MTGTVLLVDDDPVLIKLVSFMLEQKGLKVQSAANEETATKLLNETSFDVVLLDINLSEGESFDFLSNIRQQSTAKKNTPVIILSGRKDFMSVYKARTLGAVGYIVKPPDREALIKKIERLIGTESPEWEIQLNSQEPEAEVVFHPKMTLKSISPSGIILHSNIALDVEYILQDMNLSIFKTIGLAVPMIQIIKCDYIKNPKHKNLKYEIYGKFHKMIQEDQKKLMTWIFENAKKRQTQ